MSIDPPGTLRTAQTGEQTRAFRPAEPPGTTTAELVADLVAATELVAPDRLAAARGRVGPGGSLAQALLDEGLAQPDGIARALARRHNLPLVDLAETRVVPDAAQLIELRVLKRVAAIPYALVGDRLRVAVADPENIHGIDELRLASRYGLELAVANRDDILSELERLTRTSEVMETQSALDELEVVTD